MTWLVSCCVAVRCWWNVSLTCSRHWLATLVTVCSSVSTSTQSVESQKSLIARYLVEHHWTLDEWIEVEVSSRMTAGRRRLPELLAKVAAGDTVIVLELSRLGRSLREVLDLIEELIYHKRCRLILVK